MARFHKNKIAKRVTCSIEVKRTLVEPEHSEISVSRQCKLLGLLRSSLYYKLAGESEENLRLMRLIDEEYLRHPFFGSRKMVIWLKSQGERVNRKRVQRLMRQMGIEAIYPKPKTSQRGTGHRIYPYLLREMKVERPDQVWASDKQLKPPTDQGGRRLKAVATLRWRRGSCIWWR